MTTHFDFILDVHDTLSVSPSALFPLEPVGIGTPYMESLSSYVKRLAHYHHLRVVDFLAYCATQTEDDVMLATTQKFHRIDGICGSGQMWSRLLARLTQRSDVLYLSMSYWDCILNPYRLLQQHHEWCPLCYAASQKAQTPVYAPLLWSLNTVDVCLIHDVRLVALCPHCNRGFQSVTNNAMCGFCPKCKHWLGDADYTADAVSHDERAYQRAQQVGQLLALAPQVKDISRNVIPQVMEKLKQNRDIPYTHLESDLGVTTSSLMGLKTGKRLANLNTLINLAMCADNLLWFALTEREEFRPAKEERKSSSNIVYDAQQYLKQLLQSPDRLPAPGTIARQCGYTNAAALRKAYPVEYKPVRQRVREEQQGALQDVLDGDEIVGVSELARRYGYKPGYLSHYFPELCHQVTEVFRERQLNRCRSRLCELAKDDELPDFQTIRKMLGVGSRYLWRHFPDELNEIARRREQRYLDQIERNRNHLDQALASDTLPPVSLNQMATELGRSAKYLKHNFPQRSQQILQRWRDYKQYQIQDTCNQIRRIVLDLHQQGIYPSVDRLHAEISTWMIHGKVYRDVYNQALTECGYLIT